MSAKSTQGPGGKKPASAATNLIELIAFKDHKLTVLAAGGGAGMMEALICHPLGTSRANKDSF
ncbi:Mitochondrial succinate-fumarate transporter [Didymella pomorum]